MKALLKITDISSSATAMSFSQYDPNNNQPQQPANADQ